MEEHSQVVLDKAFKDLFLHPFSHSQTFLTPTAHGDQGCCARNRCFAEAHHSTWLKGFGLSLCCCVGQGNAGQRQQHSWMQLQQEDGNFICCLLGWI